ncbi:hypothetical protein V8F20_002692 [Naviculisporaceae sp. PSN 640]
MKSASVMTTLVAALGMGLTNFVSADCFGSGETWSNVNTALANAATACRETLSGSYNAGQTKTRCINHSGTGQKHDFRIRNTDGNSIQSLDVNFCTFLLSREINGCSRGGRRTEGVWEVTSDPNAGSC